MFTEITPEIDPVNRNSILYNYNPIIHEEADTTLYYLAIEYKDHTYYKIGVTTSTVAERYKGHSAYTILYAEKLVNAIAIEKQIKRDFKDDNFPLTLLGTQGTEIYNVDILELSYL